jgi:RNA polymerase sigma-70 factor (ECF subfamily)
MLATAQRLLERTGAAGDPGAIASMLATACADARARWPELGAHDDAFAEALARRLDGERELDKALGELALADVYLVAACGVGDRGALAIFERLVRGETARAVARLPHGGNADDVAQELLVRLLVSPRDGGEAKLAAYAGHGPLAAWLRVAATRTAISLHRRSAAVHGDDDALAAIADDGDDQALAFMKASYRAEFKRAFAEAIAELPRRTRMLLRLQVVDQLSIEEIGAFYQVSRATAARWLADARVQLVGGTQAKLRAALALGDDELAELGRLAASTLYATLPRLLHEAEKRKIPHR